MPRGGARPGAGRPRKNPDAPAKGATKKVAPKGEKPAESLADKPSKVEVTMEPQAHGGRLKRAKVEPKPPAGQSVSDAATRTPLEFLEAVMNDPTTPLKDRIRAAVAAAQYRHTKLHDGGKKDEAGRKAEKASVGRFAPKAPPKLVVSNG